MIACNVLSGVRRDLETSVALERHLAQRRPIQSYEYVLEKLAMTLHDSLPADLVGQVVVRQTCRLLADRWPSVRTVDSIGRIDARLDSHVTSLLRTILEATSSPDWEWIHIGELGLALAAPRHSNSKGVVAFTNDRDLVWVTQDEIVINGIFTIATFKSSGISLDISTADRMWYFAQYIL
jgi:hypothetical protein